MGERRCTAEEAFAILTKGCAPTENRPRSTLSAAWPAAAAPAAAVPLPHIDGIMQTSDGRWQVHAVSHGDRRWYRILHDGAVADMLGLDDVQRVLGDAGIALHQLVEASPAR